MKHLSEDDLILFHYGEADDTAAARAHLDGCDRCTASYAELRRTLALVDDFDRATLPERDAGYGRQVWARLAPRLEPRRAGFAWWMSQRLALVGSLAAALLLAFVTGLLVGRVDQVPPTTLTAQDAPAAGGILLIVGDHLEQSQRLLIAVINDGAGEGDLGRQRQRAAELASSNRVYRRGAAAAGDALLAEVLDELERTLLEIANAPPATAGEQLETLRRRIERRGILMKIRVLGQPESQPPTSTDEPRTENAA